MRRYITGLAGLLLLLFAVFAVAQTSGKARENRQTSTTTQTTTTQTTTTATGPTRNIEGCLIKEQSDFFLVPRSGHPIKLEPTSGENLSEHEGHKVRVSGTEMALSASPASTTAPTGGAAGAAASTSTTNAATPGSNAIGSPAGTQEGAAGAATGTGNDLHSLATEQMNVTKLQHIASSCPVNWNPNVRTPGSTTTRKP